MKKSGALVIGKKRRGENEVMTWKAPEEGWCKVNVDGACTTSCGVQVVACGGLLRNHQGTFLQGFMMKTCSTFECNNCTRHATNHARGLGDAQLWGCLLGLKTSWDFGVRKLVIETTDPTAAIVAMNHPGSLEESSKRPQERDWTMVSEIQQLLERSWEVRVTVVNRDFNVAAHALAQAALSCASGFQWLHSLPPHVLEVVLREASSGNKKVR
ncbi:uncharacterized protein LOC129289923 [Prosopis cineraria]|uniref:uncharacterized protein LOC129289923 n=1 Tax=Prosopis cineraria TaxID=364024 RepID=UPI00240EE0D1|nr:uncharacterized protein LOC129289923 [Prosopis cineraria]